MASGRLEAYRIDKADIRSVRRKRMMEISKADWKLYRERVGDGQEHYMGHSDVYSKKVIKMEDLEGFSDELIEAVKLILSR